MRRVKTDVLVVGAGLAGVMAAIEAAQEGCTVALVSSAMIFSGSSFYPGTWGFGMIAPENEQDKAELCQTICEVGMGMADPILVQTLVDGIHDGIERLQSFGITLMRPNRKGEREYIPCFDHKTRDWYGFIQKEARDGLRKKLEQLGVLMYEQTEIIELCKSEERVCGALGIAPQGAVCFSCKSCILATGGLGGLFRYALNTSDVTGAGHYLALKAGAQLYNIEFNQMMPGYIDPCYRTIYNEKVFRYSRFYRPSDGGSIFEDIAPEEEARLLELRSGHGPFTSRLDSREVDFRIFRTLVQEEQGVGLRYDEILKREQPEFVQVYFDWLRTEKGLTPEDKATIGIFYHAANGGIRIDRFASTGVAGLFACGEATGGMHGADRLGGLSTANGLVFGRIAGKSAALYAKQQPSLPAQEPQARFWEIPCADAQLLRVRELNFKAAMIFREEAVVQSALNELKQLEGGLYHERSDRPITSENASLIRQSFRLTAAVVASKALLSAILHRKESRGSHYRMDYPQTRGICQAPILLSLNNDGTVCIDFKGDCKTSALTGADKEV